MLNYYQHTRLGTDNCLCNHACFFLNILAPCSLFLFYIFKVVKGDTISLSRMLEISCIILWIKTGFHLHYWARRVWVIVCTFNSAFDSHRYYNINWDICVYLAYISQTIMLSESTLFCRACDEDFKNTSLRYAKANIATVLFRSHYTENPRDGNHIGFKFCFTVGRFNN